MEIAAYNEIEFCAIHIVIAVGVEWNCKNLLITQVAPKDLPLVQTMGCGACANEHAFKAAFMGFRVRLGEVHFPFNFIFLN